MVTYRITEKTEVCIAVTNDTEYSFSINGVHLKCRNATMHNTDALRINAGYTRIVEKCALILIISFGPSITDIFAVLITV